MALDPTKAESFTLTLFELVMRSDQAKLPWTTEFLIELGPVIAPSNLTAACSVFC